MEKGCVSGPPVTLSIGETAESGPAPAAAVPARARYLHPVRVSAPQTR